MLIGIPLSFWASCRWFAVPLARFVWVMCCSFWTPDFLAVFLFDHTNTFPSAWIYFFADNSKDSLSGLGLMHHEGMLPVYIGAGVTSWSALKSGVGFLLQPRPVHKWHNTEHSIQWTLLISMLVPPAFNLSILQIRKLHVYATTLFLLIIF